MSLVRATACLLLMLVFVPKAVAQHPCIELAKVGWYDRTYTESTESQSYSLAQWLRVSTQASSQKTWDAFVKAKFITPNGLAGALGLGAKSSNTQKFKQLSDSKLNELFQRASATNSLTEIVSPTAAEAVKACLEAQGVHAWSSTNPLAPKLVSVVIKYNGTARTPRSRVSISWYGQRGFSCQRRQIVVGTGQELPIDCKKTNPRATHKISLTTDDAPTETPVIWLLPPPVLDTVQSSAEFVGVQVSWRMLRGSKHKHTVFSGRLMRGADVIANIGEHGYDDEWKPGQSTRTWGFEPGVVPFDRADCPKMTMHWEVGNFHKIDDIQWTLFAVDRNGQRTVLHSEHGTIDKVTTFDIPFSAGCP